MIRTIWNRYVCIIAIFCYGYNVWSQNCNCDITYTPEMLANSEVNIINGENTSVLPGQTICLTAGNYNALRFININGTEEAPIVIKNCDGLVTINALSYSGISLQKSSYIKVSGTGDNTVDYGFKIAYTNSFSSAVYMENFTTDIEVDHIEIENAGFAGIMGKTDPYCDNPQTWRRNGFVMKNINIHHNYIHDVEGEGIYLGFTGGYKVESNRNCDGDPIFGHWLEHITVADNIVERTGLDGIQINLAREDCIVKNNVISDYALAGQNFQDFALSLGGGIYTVYNNRTHNSGVGKGIQLISADSGTLVYNNVIENPGFHGFFIHQRHEFLVSTIGVSVLNNTIINPDNSGIFYNTTITSSEYPFKLGTTQNAVPSHFINNVIVNPGNNYATGNTWKQDSESYIDFNDKSTRDAMLPYVKTNMFTRQYNELYFLDDTSEDDFEITSFLSVLVDSGTDVSSFGVHTDILGILREQGLAYDIGAYEYIFPDGFFDELNITGGAPIAVYPNPVVTTFGITGDEVKGATIYIYSSSGELVWEKEAYEGEFINAAQWATGKYYVLVTSDTKKRLVGLLVKKQ